MQCLEKALLFFRLSHPSRPQVKLWTGLRDWLLLTTAWNNTVFGSINPEEVTQEVNKYSKLVAQVSRSMPDNPVVLKLKAMVEEFKLTLPAGASVPRWEADGVCTLRAFIPATPVTYHPIPPHQPHMHMQMSTQITRPKYNLITS